MYIWYLKDTTILKDTGILQDSEKNMETLTEVPVHNSEACTASINAVRDTLYVLNGKWKLPIIMALRDNPMRFKDLQRALGDITPKILSKELKDLELNEFIRRNVFATTPVTVTYQGLPYCCSLSKVLDEMRDWGLQHRQKLVNSRKG